jgi:hypothetical protein
MLPLSEANKKKAGAEAPALIMSIVALDRRYN